jgi:hypothetical protein
MRLVPIFVSLLAAAMLCAPGARAAGTVYKCRVDGKLSYSDRPCPSGQSQALPPAPAGIPVGDTAGVATGDSRTLLDLEKARTERAKQEAIENRESRAQARAGHVRVRQLERCQKLQLQHKWLEEDLAKAQTPSKQAAARTKLKRQAETMAVECPG